MLVTYFRALLKHSLVLLSSVGGGGDCTRNNPVLRKQLTFRDANAGFPLKPTNQNHCPDLGSASDWLCHMVNLTQPIRITTQIWVVMHHQYEISTLVSKMSFGGGNQWWHDEVSSVCSAKIIQAKYD